LQQAQQQLQSDLNKTNESIQEELQRKSQHDMLVEQIKSKNEKKSIMLKQIDDKIKETLMQKSNALYMIEKTEEHIEKHLKSVAKLEKSLKKLQNDYNEWEELQNIFGNKGVKSDILSLVTPHLNGLIMKYMRTLDEIDIMFTTQVKQKSGKVVDKFGIVVDNKNGAKEYHLNSSGEKQKINLVASLSFHIFIKKFLGIDINVLFMDEPFESLDNGSSEAVINMLKQLQDEFDKVFIISHNQAIKDLIQDTVIVEKNNKVSKIV
jgi:DNA repair exonuclease SbcCD ATPase subunit